MNRNSNLIKYLESRYPWYYFLALFLLLCVVVGLLFWFVGFFWLRNDFGNPNPAFHRMIQSVSTNSTLVLYTCHFPEDATEAYLYLKNLEFFLKFGVLAEFVKREHYPKVDYHFYFSRHGNSGVSDEMIQSMLNMLPNINPSPFSVRFKFGENLGSDICAAHRELNEVHLDSYEFVGMINCVARGPFVDLALSNQPHFLSVFHSVLVANVKLAGSFITSEFENGSYLAHIQSFALFAHRDIFDLLLLHLSCLFTFEDTTTEVEIELSQSVLNNGWNIADLQQNHVNLDFRKEKWIPSSSSFYQDPYNTLFVKFGGNNFRLQRISTADFARIVQLSKTQLSFVNRRD